MHVKQQEMKSKFHLPIVCLITTFIYWLKDDEELGISIKRMIVGGEIVVDKRNQLIRWIQKVIGGNIR